MNVLFVTPRFGETTGGDGLYAYYLARGLIAQGAQISVLTVRDGRFFLSGTVHKEGAADGHVLGEIGRGLFAQNFYSNSARRAVAFAVQMSRPDVIHIHGIHQYFTVSTAQVLKIFSVPSLISIHDYKILCGNAGFFSNRTNAPCVKCLHGGVLPPIGERCKNDSLIESIGASIQMSLWKYVKAFDAIDCFHCGSHFVFDLLKQNNEIKHKLVEIRLPYLREPNNDRGDSSRMRQANIVFIGRLVPHKGITVFAEAVKEIREAVIDVFGDGPLLNDAKQILKNNRNVRFHGWKSHDEMEEYLFPGTIVVVPYLAYETFCFVVLEAMLRGCCVVATGRGAIPELIINGHNGIIIEEPTSENFRRVLEDLLSQEEKILSLGRNAMETRNSVSSLAVHGKEMLKLYEKLVASRQGNRG